MTDTATSPSVQGEVPPLAEAAPTAAAAERANARALVEAARRAEETRQAPELHVPKLVTSRHFRGESPLDEIADAVNRFCGSMWVFLGITTGIVVWLFAGNVVGFDKDPLAAAAHPSQLAPAVHNDLVAGQREPGTVSQRQARDS